MSRTLKDRPSRIRFPKPSYDELYERVAYEGDVLLYRDKRRNVAVWSPTGTKYGYFHIQRPGVKTKKPRHVDTEWNWLGSTPSWWTRLMMNRPMRARGRAWERKVLSNTELEPPTVSKKPHEYYW